MYNFTPEYYWFEAAKEALHECLYFMSDHPLNFLEIGSFEGASATWMLDSVLTHKDSRLTCIDTWQGGPEHSHIDMKKVENTFWENINKTGKRDKVTVYKGKSHEILRALSPQSYDFIYIDGSHLSFHVLEDAILSHRLLKIDGLLAFDDNTGHDKLDRELWPFYAIEAFKAMFSTQYILYRDGGQVFLKKTKEI